MVEETTGRDGLEIGSLILGRSRSTVVELLLACRPGGVPVRGEAFFRSDPDYETDILRRVAPMGVDAVAYWHAHPRGHRDLSKQDLQAGMWKRSAAGVSCFVEVLVVPSGASWELECWTMRRDDSGAIRKRDSEPSKMLHNITYCSVIEVTFCKTLGFIILYIQR